MALPDNKKLLFMFIKDNFLKNNYHFKDFLKRQLYIFTP